VLRIAIRVARDESEVVRARLLELVPEGLEELDLNGEVELAVYVDEARARLLRAAFPGVTASPVEPGWEDAWRRFHRPVVAGDVWIGPPWERPPADRASVIVDPGRAFGTGAHPTTRLCIEHLERLERGSLLDVGCGSGLVALAGARLGYAPIVAVDSDPVAIASTWDNAARNGVALNALVLDALVDELPPARVAVVNILLPAVEKVLARLDADVAVTSGYLVGETPVVVGWTPVARLELGGWAADAFERAPRRAAPL
jgi:ribosomal protein L11 methyltransferase